MLCRGGSYNNGTSAGILASYARYTTSNTDTNIGFILWCWSSTGTRVLARGGAYPDGASAGLLAFAVNLDASSTLVYFGFRLAATIGTE